MQGPPAALVHEVEHALALLQHRHVLDDDAIHEIRQGLKRARAALRLLRDAIPARVYARENRRLRDAARPLAAARDARVMLAVLDELIAHTGSRPYRPMLARLRSQLQRPYARHLDAARAPRRVAAMRRQLERSLESAAGWRLPRELHAIYAGGLARVYGQGREALDEAAAKRTAAALHEWRKQAKYLAAALALVAAKKSRAAKARKRAEELAHELGDEHDLAVLVAVLRRRRADRALLAELESRRHKLQKRALKAGQRLYRHSPERFIARLQNISPAASKS